MKKRVFRLFPVLLAFSISGLILLSILNRHELNRREQESKDSLLSPEQKMYIREALRLKNDYGKKVCPGFDTTSIAVVVFNNAYEFLLTGQKAENNWEKIRSDDFFNRPYFRRRLVGPKAFAVRVGKQWAGMLGTLNQMNFEFLNGIRQELPPVMGSLFPYFLARIAPDQYVVSLLHEMFHAFQAMRNPSRFAQTQSLYSAEDKYPYNDRNFIDLWNKEGARLAEALAETDPEKMKEPVREFIRMRKLRREKYHITDELLHFERELEWLEGLAKYAEIRFYEIAAEEDDHTSAISYRKGLPHWQMEFKRLRKNLGEQRGDFRFYLSGMAQARLLDRFDPDWKSKIEATALSLEELLISVLQKSGEER